MLVLVEARVVSHKHFFDVLISLFKDQIVKLLKKVDSRVNGDIPNFCPKLLARQVSQGIAVDSDKTWFPFVIKKPDHDDDTGFEFRQWPVHDKKVTSAAVGTRIESFTR